MLLGFFKNTTGWVLDFPKVLHFWGSDTDATPTLKSLSNIICSLLWELCCSDSPKLLPHPCRMLQKCTTFEVFETPVDIFEESEQHRWRMIWKSRLPQKWLVAHELQHDACLMQDNLQRRGICICDTCDQNVSHLLLLCSVIGSCGANSKILLGTMWNAKFSERHTGILGGAKS